MTRLRRVIGWALIVGLVGFQVAAILCAIGLTVWYWPDRIVLLTGPGAAGLCYMLHELWVYEICDETGRVRGPQ